jgi:serine/threonine protein kinase
MHDAVAQKFG